MGVYVKDGDGDGDIIRYYKILILMWLFCFVSDLCMWWLGLAIYDVICSPGREPVNISHISFPLANLILP